MLTVMPTYSQIPTDGILASTCFIFDDKEEEKDD
jgi:hypothetical protein